MSATRGRIRVAESMQEIDALCNEVEQWFLQAPTIGVAGQYESSLRALRDVLTVAAARVRSDLDTIPLDSATGAAYDAARASDRRIALVRRFWRWFADRFDQRQDPKLRDVLHAADEVIWSSWKPVWIANGVAKPGPAPLPYIEARFNAAATPRSAPPPELSARGDEALADAIGRLPIPVVGLPPIVERRPWWLVLLVHETGHHVQYDLDPCLVDDVRDGVRDAAERAGAGADEQQNWLAWSREMFADAFAAVFAGAATRNAVEDLELRDGRGALVSPANTYPPPVVRLAVIDSVLAIARGATPDVDADMLLSAGTQVPADLANSARELLARVPAVARALLDYPKAATLGALGANTRRWEAQTTVWRDQLLGEPHPNQELDTARLCAAGAMHAWRELAAVEEPSDEARDALAKNVIETLHDSREAGTRAGAADRTTDTKSVVDALFDATDGNEP